MVWPAPEVVDGIFEVCPSATKFCPLVNKPVALGFALWWQFFDISKHFCPLVRLGPNLNSDDIIFNYSHRVLTEAEKMVLARGLRFCLPPKKVGGSKILVTGHWSLVTGHWSLVAGRWSLVAGRWSLVAGRWSLVAGRWSLVAGRWSLVAGRWSLVAGHWSLVAGHSCLYFAIKFALFHPKWSKLFINNSFYRPSFQLFVQQENLI